MDDELWEDYGITVLFLPPRSPELNPIELVWNILVQRLKNTSVEVLRQIGPHSAAIATEHILQSVTHKEVFSTYCQAAVVRTY